MKFKSTRSILPSKGEVSSTPVYLDGVKKKSGELPIAYPETALDRTIERLMIVTYHPEGFSRERRLNNNDRSRVTAVRERLIGFRQTIMYGKPQLLCLLSTCAYLYDKRRGNLIPTEQVLKFSESNGALKKYFRR